MKVETILNCHTIFAKNLSVSEYVKSIYFCATLPETLPCLRRELTFKLVLTRNYFLY